MNIFLVLYQKSYPSSYELHITIQGGATILRYFFREYFRDNSNYLMINAFNPIVPNWLKVAFQLDTTEYLCHTKVQVPLLNGMMAILVVITMSTAPSFGSAVTSVTKRHARVGSYHRVPFHDETWTPIRENIFSDSGSDMSSHESSPPTSEDSDEEHIPTLSYSSEKQNFRSGWRTASAPDYSVSDRPCNLQNTPVVLKITVSSHPSKSCNCTLVKQYGN